MAGIPIRVAILCTLLSFLFFPGSLAAQNVVPNGDFELRELGRWEKTGDNISQYVYEYDVTGWGPSWCWKRRPGWGNNGGIKQQVHLIAGETYLLEADLAFLCTSGGIDEGGTYDVSIDDDLVGSYSVGSLPASNDPVRVELTGIYTASATGYHEFEVFNYRDAEMDGSTYNFIDNVRLAPEVPDFETSSEHLSITDAGSVEMLLKPGPSWANGHYLVLAAFDPYPGFVLDGIQVHLNMDGLFWYSLQNLNGPNFENSQGKLDSQGEAVFTFNTLGPTPALCGEVITFEYFMLTSSSYPRPIQYASHPVRLNFVP